MTMRFSDIPRFTRSPAYAVDLDLSHLERAVEQYVREDGLDLDPDFQRAHVWTEAQQIAFMEYLLRGGRSGCDLYTNCPGWQIGSRVGPYVLVDGKQRLNAALRWLRNEIPTFGRLRRDFQGPLRIIHGGFKWHVNDLATRAEVLTWYLEMNAGGTPHTAEEIAKVRRLLAAEFETTQRSMTT